MVAMLDMDNPVASEPRKPRRGPHARTIASIQPEGVGKRVEPGLGDQHIIVVSGQQHEPTPVGDVVGKRRTQGLMGSEHGANRREGLAMDRLGCEVDQIAVEYQGRARVRTHQRSEVRRDFVREIPRQVNVTDNDVLHSYS
jgi:hypothetical protein